MTPVARRLADAHRHTTPGAAGFAACNVRAAPARQDFAVGQRGSRLAAIEGTLKGVPSREERKVWGNDREAGLARGRHIRPGERTPLAISYATRRDQTEPGGSRRSVRFYGPTAA